MGQGMGMGVNTQRGGGRECGHGGGRGGGDEERAAAREHGGLAARGKHQEQGEQAHGSRVVQPPYRSNSAALADLRAAL
jgi:hypothetical protein